MNTHVKVHVYYLLDRMLNQYLSGLGKESSQETNINPG